MTDMAAEALKFASDGMISRCFWPTWARAQKVIRLRDETTPEIIALKIAIGLLAKSRLITANAISA